MSAPGSPALTNCKQCTAPTDPLGMFPGGVCLPCWAQSPEGRRMPTADEVTRMWGGPVSKRARHRPAREITGTPEEEN